MFWQCFGYVWISNNWEYSGIEWNRMKLPNAIVWNRME